MLCIIYAIAQDPLKREIRPVAPLELKTPQKAAQALRKEGIPCGKEL